MLKQTFHSLGLLILRVAFGCFMLTHGWQKLSGFGEMADNFADPVGLGSRTSLLLAIFAEFGCSILLIVGFLTRLATVPLAITMLVALFVVHGADPWQKKELAACYLAVYLTLFFTGPGVFAVDHLVWGKRKEGLEV